ncbi:MAG: ice-binding family protein, partial [Pseudobdellovibrionaceae bacterium]
CITTASPAAVNLGTAGNFVILSESGITDVPTSAVTGNVGTSPITGAADLLTCTEVTGNIYSVDAAGPAPCSIEDPTTLTTAVGDMETAYTNAAGRTLPDFVNLGAGDISGLTLTPGLYKWSTGVLINSDVTLNGGPNDVWIFQIAEGITQASATKIILAGEAQAKNIFWQCFGAVTIGTTAHFEGTILTKTAITLNTGATINGRLLAQTAVNLEANVVTQP